MADFWKIIASPTEAEEALISGQHLDANIALNFQ